MRWNLFKVETETIFCHAPVYHGNIYFKMISHIGSRINYIDYFVAIRLFYRLVLCSIVMTRTACGRVFNMTSKNKCLILNEKIKLIESSEKDKLSVIY